MDGARDQLFTGAAFPGNQHAAGLRRDRLDQVEDFAHFRAGADNVIEPGKAAQFAAQLARFFAQRLIFRNTLHRGAKLVQQTVALDSRSGRRQN